jgi:uncharacterized protein (UPF0218 family)
VLVETIKREQPAVLILVGDTISRNAIQSGIEPNILIIDRLEKRSKAVPFLFHGMNLVRVKNAPGRIEMNAWNAINEAIRDRKTLVEVDGEEDLLTIPAVLNAPIGSLIVYGQPGVGIVIITVSEEMKSATQRLLDAMEKHN